MKAPRAIWVVEYENVNVSDELAPMLTSIEYTDNLKGKSDELSITCEDRKGRWRGGWFPSEGDRLVVRMGWEGEPLLECGKFKVDEVSFRGPPDTVTISAQAAVGAKKPLRSVTHRSFEDTSLAQLAAQLCRELELELVGEVADVKIRRVTQGETTLAFLHRLATDYGYAFSVRPPRLVFYEIAKLEAAASVAVLKRTDLKDYDLKAKTQATYQACELTFFDATSKKNITVRVEQDQARQAVIVGSGGGTTGLDVPPELPTRTLQQGSTGEDVKKWQAYLRSRGLDVGPIDGIFGTKTRAATIEFQRSAGISPDGVAGRETFRAAVSMGYGPRTTDTTHAETAGNVLRITRRVETIEQAQWRARAELAAANRLKTSGSLTVIGRPKLVAGTNFELDDMGRMSGAYTVGQSKHKMDRSGAYTTALGEVTRIPAPTPAAPQVDQGSEEDDV